MHTKRNIIWTVILTLYCFVTLNAFASDSTTGLDKLLKPCIDDQTFAVIHIDVEKLNLDGFVEKALSIVNTHTEPDIARELQKELKIFQTEADAELNNLIKFGVKDIFMVFSMYDFPYFFVAIPSGSNPAGLSQYITKITEDFNVGRIELFSSDGLIVVGLEQTIARVKTISPVQSEILVKGLQACGGSTFQAVLFPSSDQRRILSEMLPAIPFESGRIELSSLTNNMQWAALGFNTPPSASIHFTIQSTSAEAADSNLTLIKSLFSFLGQNPDIRKFMPEVNQVLKHLIPQRHDKQLLLQVDTITADSIINDFIAPSLLKVNTTATRLACAKNLKSLGMALFIYANDYDDQLPPDMETLLQYEVSENSLVCPATKLKDSYIFRGANLKTSEPPFMIWIYDKKGNHEGGRYVLFNDGHVDWATEERFMELIEEDNKYRMEKGLPLIPAQ